MQWWPERSCNNFWLEKSVAFWQDIPVFFDTKPKQCWGVTRTVANLLIRSSFIMFLRIIQKQNQEFYRVCILSEIVFEWMISWKLIKQLELIFPQLLSTEHEHPCMHQHQHAHKSGHTIECITSGYCPAYNLQNHKYMKSRARLPLTIYCLWTTVSTSSWCWVCQLKIILSSSRDFPCVRGFI